jgi:hypothetical protein
LRLPSLRSISFFFALFSSTTSSLTPLSFSLSLSTRRTLGDVLAQRLDSSARSKKAAAAGTTTTTTTARGGKASSSGKTRSSSSSSEGEEQALFPVPLAVRHLAASALYGACVVGPLGHAWYRWLDAFVSARFLRGSAKFVASKVLLDEVVFGPVHVAGFFATVVVVAEGGGLTEVASKVRRDFASTYAAELAFWPAFQAVNFWRVPVRHQLLAVNLACLLDATFLCWASAHDDWVAAARSALGMEEVGVEKGEGGKKKRGA